MFNLKSVIYPLFFFSGLAGLIYETVWVRQFTGIFGSTTGSLGAVTAAFMLGMAVGGAFLGRLGDRLRDRLVLFAALEALVGLYGIFSSYGFGTIEDFYYSVGGGQGLKFFLAGTFLLVPTFLMGGTLPVLSRFVLREEKGDFGLSAGRLYAVGTCGAAAGTFIAGFYLLEHLGAANTLRTAGIINLIVAVTAVLLRFSKQERPDPTAAAGETAPALNEGARPAPAREAGIRGFPLLALIMAFFLSGAAVLSMEVIWTRLLSQFFRNSVYSYAGMLVCVLLGLAAGGGAGAWLSGRIRSPRRTLALCQLLAALTTLLTLYVFQYFGDLDRYRTLIRSFGGFESFGGLALFEVAFAFCVVFPPTFFLGTAFPLMAAMSWRRTSRFGGFIGDIQFLSTAGAMAGSLVTAFWLLAAFKEDGLFKCVLIAVGLNGAAALLLMAARPLQEGFRPRQAGRKSWIAVLGLLAACVLLAWGHSEKLKFWKGSPADEELVFYKEDAMANVAVVRRPDGLVMKVNNTTGLGGTSGAVLEARLGMMPPLLFGKPGRALVLGLGTGNTLMGLVGSGPREIDCVEIVPGVLKAAHFFHSFQNEVPYDTKLNFYEGMDARIFLAVRATTYDLILGDLFFPWQSGAGFLYTREHFIRVREHLNPGGVFCQWIPLYQLHWEDFGIIGYTFSEVFDNVTVFLASAETAYPVVGLMGTLDPVRFDPAEMQQRIDVHPHKWAIEQLGLDNAMENLSLYIGDYWLFRARFPDLVLNTLDRTIVEFRAARVFENQEVLGFNQFFQLAVPGLKENVVSFLDRERLQGTERGILEMEIAAYSEGIREYLASHAYELGEEILRGSTRFLPGQEPGKLRRLSEKRLEAGLRAFNMAPNHRVLRGNLDRIWRSLIQKEELKVAANLMQAGCARLPDDEEFAFNWGLSYLLQELYDEACITFEMALETNPAFFRARVHYAIALFCSGKRVQAREELDRALIECGPKAEAMLSKSELTQGLVDLILEGVEQARPLLEKSSEEGPWGGLILTAIKQAREGEDLRPDKDRTRESKTDGSKPSGTE